MMRGETKDRLEGKADGEREGRIEGRYEGRIQGKEEGKELAPKNLAQKLMSRGFELDDIAQLTGLSLAEIKNIHSGHKADNS